MFAVLPAPSEPIAAEAAVNNRFGYMMQNMTGNTRMVCLSREGGEIWSTTASKIKLEKPGPLSFIGSPIVTQQGVFTMARKAGDGSFTELYLVRLDRDSGAVSWTCYLCSASSGSYYMPMILPNIPVPSVVDDVVYICTGEGADCAVDANAGRILWLAITEAAKETKSMNQIYNPAVTTTPSWKFNPPLVAGDKLIACETSDSSSYLRVYDRWTGKVLRSLKKEDLDAMGVGKVDVLAGVIGSTVIVTGNNICALDIDTGKKVWTEDFLRAESGNPQGRPFLSATALYVPFVNGMLNVDPRNGVRHSFWPWPSTEETEKSGDGTQKPIHAKPGNLLVTSEQVIVVNDEEVAGYSKWETARDNRLAKIKERPTEPEPYLNLAEISFRTEHLDLAEENMKRSVELANAADAGSAAGRASDFLGRLYHTNLNFAQQLLGSTDTEKRDRGRFYYEECKLTARDAEEQAEWRLCMSELSLAQKKGDEAALLYNQVLTDPNLRGAPYKRADSLARAGVIAEQLFRTLINKDPNGAAIYRRFEDQAAALFNKARATKDSMLLGQVIDSYPNSVSALAAASDLASAARAAHDPVNELKALYWLGPRVNDEKTKAAVIAQTAMACLALPKPRYGSAIAWAERGLRQYKDFTWTDAATNQAMTFAGLRDEIRANPAAASTRGRAPVLPPLVSLGGTPPVKAPDMAPISSDDPPFAAGSLLVPVEGSPALRRPDLLFVLHGNRLHMFDTAHDAELTVPQKKLAGGLVEENGLELPETPASPANAPSTILLGCVGDTAVLVQRNMAIGIDLRSRLKAWQVPLIGAGGGEARPAQAVAQARLLALRQRQAQLNGAAFVDPQTGEVVSPSPVDEEVARQTAFMSLGSPGFNTLRLMNDKLIVVAGDKISAINVATGKRAWPGAAGDGVMTIPVSGTAEVALGNEDVIVAEVQAADRAGAIYVVFDAETGKFRKQFRVDERPLWRDLSDDGLFFVVSSREVSAFNMLNENSNPLWQRADLRCAFPGATLLTLDGLLLVNSPSELMCLSAESGERRWPVQTGDPVNLDPPGAVPGRAAFLRATVEGDLAIYQSGSTLGAYQTSAVPGDHVAWKAEVRQNVLPALSSFQTSDGYVVALASGPSASARHEVDLVLFDLLHGNIRLTTPLWISPKDPGRGGPNIRAWQVVDNGIAMEINGNVVFYHGRKSGAAAQKAAP